MKQYAGSCPTVLRSLIFLCCVLIVAGCGSKGPFRDRGFDYLRAEPVPPLVYPEGMRPIPAQELYPVSGIENRPPVAADKQKRIEIPKPPQVVDLNEKSADQPATPAADGGKKVVSAAQVVLTRDGNAFPVLMLDINFDWAWQAVGDALKAVADVKVEDIDRGRAIYYLSINGKRSSADEPWQLKLNYTLNGIQLALQIDENTMAAAELSAPLMQSLRDGILKESLQ